MLTADVVAVLAVDRVVAPLDVLVVVIDEATVGLSV